MKKLFCIGATVLLWGGVNYRDLIPEAIGSASAQSAIAQTNSTPDMLEASPLEMPESNDLENSATDTNSIEVTLIEPGTEPRQLLRFNPVVDLLETTEMTMAMDISAMFDGVPAPEMPYPDTAVTILTEVTDIDAEGNIYVDFSYQDVELVESDNLDPTMGEMIQQQLEYLEDLQGQFVIDPKGAIISSNIDFPEGSDSLTQQTLEQFTSSIEQTSHPFPVEPVGVGAVWQVVSNLKAGFGIDIQQTATYKLVKLEQEQVTLEVSVEQQASGQSISLPEVPADISVNLTELNSSGGGRVIMSLERIMPLASTVYVDSEMVMSMKEPTTGQEFTMQMLTQMQMDMLSKLQP